MKPKIKPTVTVGITAHNEALTITAMLAGLFRQRITFGRLEKIVVIPASSTDQTTKIVGRMRHPKGHLICTRKRIGQPMRVSQIIQSTLTKAF